MKCSVYPRIYLASQSPRRQELLRQIGVSFDVLNVSIDETPVEHETPLAYVRRIAHDKAQGAWEHIMRHELPATPVLAADTTVALGDLILGKPFDADDACKVLRSLSGQQHVVMSAVAVAFAGTLELAVSQTAVTFKMLSAAEISRYAASAEPYDKAGAYAIQERAAGFITRIDGSYSGVMGLPLFETVQLLEKFGVSML